MVTHILKVLELAKSPNMHTRNGATLQNLLADCKEYSHRFQNVNDQLRYCAADTVLNSEARKYIFELYGLDPVNGGVAEPTLEFVRNWTSRTLGEDELKQEQQERYERMINFKAHEVFSDMMIQLGTELQK